MKLPAPYLWKNMKSVIEAQIERAGITDEAVIKLILKYEKSANTCKNELAVGKSWEAVCYSRSRTISEQALDELYENHQVEMQKYCDANGFFYGFTVGDALS